MFALALVLALRIVSLAPSVTEMLFAVGAGPSVVGVDAYSNRPSGARVLPHVGGLHSTSTETVLALHPDLVIGVDYDRRTMSDLARSGVRTEIIDVESLASDYAALERVGTLSGHAKQAHAVVASLQRRAALVASRARADRVLTAYVAIDVTGMYTAGPGSFLDDVLHAAHLRNVVALGLGTWPKYSAERLIEDQPDVIIVPASDRAALVGPPWDRLDAVRLGHVIAIADDDLLRPGPRIIDVLEGLARRVRPWR